MQFENCLIIANVVKISLKHEYFVHWFSGDLPRLGHEFDHWVVTVLGRPGRGDSQVQKSPRLNWTTQFLTVACYPNVSVGMVWIFFGALPCRKRKLDDSSRLDVVEIASVAWHASFQPL